LLTLVGHAAAISAGEWVTATGNPRQDRIIGLLIPPNWLSVRRIIDHLRQSRTPTGLTYFIALIAAPSSSCCAR
jgi:hypothetical protein